MLEEALNRQKYCSGGLQDTLDRQKIVLERSRMRWIDKNSVPESSRRLWIEKIMFRRHPGTLKMLQDALEGLKHYACSVFTSLARATRPSSVASESYPGPHRSSLVYMI